MGEHEHDEEDSVELSNDMAAAQDDEPTGSVERTAHGEAVEDVPEDDEDDAEGDDDAQDDQDADEDADGEAPPAKGKGKQTARERIEELARSRREAQQQAFAAELREIEKDRRIAELEARMGGGAASEDDPEPNPSDFTYGHVDDQYVNAVVDWRARQQVREIQQQEQVRQNQQQEMQVRQHYMTRMNEVLESGEKKHPGFKEAVNATTYDGDLARQVLDSDIAVDLAFHLANNLDDLRSLLKATPAERARHLGRIEGRLSAPSAAKKRTRAPEPPGSGRVRSATSTRYGPDDQDEFDKAYFS